MNDKIYIILVNYNGAKDTINCIKSIKEYEKEIKYEIIVVDNLSTDNSIEELEKLDNITLIKSKINGGFAKGNNIGIEYAIKKGAQYILLLNNDTIICENSISILLKRLKEESEIGIVGSRIMYYEDKSLINYYGGKFNWFKGITIHEGYKQKYIEDNQKNKNTDFITGCCMLIKREVIEKVGMLPEEYFMYFEDADYCMQVLEKGYKLEVCADSVIYHKVSVSSGGENSAFSIKWGNRNRLIFINKYKKYTKGILTKIIFYVTRFILFIKYNIVGEKEKSKAIIEGIKEGNKYLRNQKGELK